MSTVLVNDLFDELKDENRRLLQIVSVLFEFKEFCHSIITRLDQNNDILSETDRQTYAELNQKLLHLDTNTASVDNESNVKKEPETGSTVVNDSNGGDGQQMVSTTATRPRKTKIPRTRHSKTEYEVTANGAIVCKFAGCGQTLKHKNSWNNHRKIHTNEGRVLSCSVEGCDYQSKSAEYFRAHMNRHKGVRPYECQVCHKAFLNNPALRKHFNFKHNVSGETMVCKIDNCLKEFQTVASFRQHKLNCHPIERRHICSWPGCPFVGINSSVLKYHMYVHTSERPHKCDVEGCVKTFKTIRDLKDHKENAHVDERAFQCEVKDCHKTFKSRKAMLTHIRVTHTAEDKRCDWPGCDYTTKSSHRLSDHRDTHTPDRKFRCDWPECGRLFKTNHTLAEHKRVHRQDKRYACHWPGCQYRCVSSGNIYKHLRVHVKNNKSSLHH